MEENFRYCPLSSVEYQELWQKHKKIITSFISANNYSIKGLHINKKAVLSIIAKVHQRKKYFEYFHGLDMSEFKEVSLICFWYIKLKPICVLIEDTEEFDSINERLALYYLLRTYRHMLMKEKLSTRRLDTLPESYLKEVIYSFKYRDISKEALTLLVESIAIFLGLNPYLEE